MARHESPIRTAFLVSGEGRTAKAVLQANLPRIHPVLMVSSNERAGALRKAEDHGMQTAVTPFDSENADSINAAGAQINLALRNAHVDLVVITGWREVIPQGVVAEYWDRSIAQQPAPLDPKRIRLGIDLPIYERTGADFSGSNMRGTRTHAAVLLYAAETQGALTHTEATTYRPGDETPRAVISRKQTVLEVPPHYMTQDAVRKDQSIYRELLERAWQLEEDMVPAEQTNMIRTLEKVSNNFSEFASRERYNVLQKRRQRLIPLENRELLADVKNTVVRLFPRP